MKERKDLRRDTSLSPLSFILILMANTRTHLKELFSFLATLKQNDSIINNTRLEKTDKLNTVYFLLLLFAVYHFKL